MIRSAGSLQFTSAASVFVSARFWGFSPAISAFFAAACETTTWRLWFWTFQILISGVTHFCSAAVRVAPLRAAPAVGASDGDRHDA